MQNVEKAPPSPVAEITGISRYSEAAPDTLVFELVVPGAAKVPAARPPFELNKLVVQLASASTTVPSSALTVLRANNTARGAYWCFTVTLQVRQLPARY